MAAALLTAAAVTGCGSSGAAPPEPPAFALASPGVGPDGRLDPAHLCAGGSPALTWSGVPAGTRELALVMRRDGARPAATRWLVAGITPDRSGLPAALPRVSRGAGGVPGLRQGVDDRGRIGYDAPCGRADAGGYTIRLVALSRRSRLGDGHEAGDLRRAMRGAVLAEAVLAFTVAPSAG